MPSFRAAFQIRRWLVALSLLSGAALPSAFALPPNVQEYHTKQPVLTIPYSSTMPGSRIREVELYSSTDQGRTWTYVTQAQISGRREDNKFRHTIPTDGTYWFGVRSIDQAGTAFPPNVDQLQPGLVVHLDRRAPLVQLRSATPTRPNVVGVEWDVREEHFDASRFVMEYRVPGQSDWVAQPVEAKPTGTQYWELTTAPRLEVRVRVADRAGNEADAALALSPGNAGATSSSSGANQGFEPSNTNTGGGTTNTPQRPGVHYINSTQIAIPYRISNVGVSGVPVTDLWVTRDLGRNWQKVPKGTDDTGNLPATPGEGETITKQFTYSASGEGLYGFTIVVRSGVGIGDTDPRSGEQPKRLIEVDTTRPEIETRITRGTGPDVRNVTIEWTARDKNLLERPVSILWSKTKEGGEWEPVVTDLESRGRYVWTISDQGPFQFFIQVRAVDKAGNIGSATGNDQITVDLNRPKADLLDPVPIKK